MENGEKTSNCTRGDDEMLYINLFFTICKSIYKKQNWSIEAIFIVGLLSDLSLQAVNLIFILVVFGAYTSIEGMESRRSNLYLWFLFSTICHLFQLSLIYGILMIDTLLKGDGSCINAADP